MKEQKLVEIKKDLEKLGFEIVGEDLEKPWGAYFVIADKDADAFVDKYFKKYREKLPKGAVVSPKFLILEPGKQFSWQVHNRRGEVWYAVEGPLGAYIGETDELPEEYLIFEVGESLYMEKGVRHRLKGLDTWGVVAEIWVHTDSEQLSDESDIRRIVDDFNR